MKPLLPRVGWLALAAAACGGAPAGMPGTLVASTDRSALPSDPQPTAAPPIATVGERMAYRVSIHGVTLAELDIDVTGKTPLDGRQAIVVEANVDTQSLASLVSPVHDRFATWIDAETGRPLQFHAQEKASPDAQAQEETEAHFAPGSYPVRLVLGDSAGTQETQVVRGTPFDFTAFLIFLRSWEAAVGTEMSVDIMRSRFVWRVRTVVGGRSNLVTALGELPVVRFEGEGVRLLRDGTVNPQSDRRRFTIWISDDADRVPVKLSAHTDYGDVLLELAAYTAGDH
ncbi:MAG TPA: DUF3108 domain-containing protein [Kofleriaceae bacterium]|nr:DUF3108 domain-containing protein [Kofleriaceae bacterium]